MKLEVHPPKNSHPANYCEDCHESCPTQFIVHDKLWREVYGPDKPEFMMNLLCLDCFQRRLGRNITWEDLKPCGFRNLMYLALILYRRAGCPELEVNEEAFIRDF